MSEQPTQRTPKGAEIPIPTRGDVFRDLDKAAKPIVANDVDAPTGADVPLPGDAKRKKRRSLGKRRPKQ